MKKLMTYAADKGSCVINGVCIDNGVGDGEFDVFFVDDVKKVNRPVKIIDGIWFDLRFKSVMASTFRLAFLGLSIRNLKNLDILYFKVFLPSHHVPVNT